jgi:hypothetical protein
MAYVKMLHKDEKIELLIQPRHTGHDREELLWRREVLEAALVSLQRLQLILLGGNLQYTSWQSASCLVVVSTQGIQGHKIYTDKRPNKGKVDLL